MSLLSDNHFRSRNHGKRNAKKTPGQQGAKGYLAISCNEKNEKFSDFYATGLPCFGKSSFEPGRSNIFRTDAFITLEPRQRLLFDAFLPILAPRVPFCP
ncbi:hypothetical protein HKD31_13220 [Gluconobacter sp. R71646]|uniref:Transposase n=1 Tax=Gluconobacter potus TaxID=2724927 RepID=A0ABR9YPG2_9PROT|nr:MULTISPECIES: hypothetical protein [Gluconobacter]MBF0865664.1 hypothetical protein [Gluconobacter sp. R71656]MBF0868697.1 hypothetical protein [Gluconobacter sp. R75628]MBF0874679.1 hypothetical protein [Gluconobacter sp. R75629]MBF0883694.1 hypothetical protein [Gluconobacter potus]